MFCRIPTQSQRHECPWPESFYRSHRQAWRNAQCHGGRAPLPYGQYGPSQELPWIDNNPRYRKFAHDNGNERLWRITCFVVHKNFRCRGVAHIGLKAALAAIQNEGGGLVEPYPIKRWGAYQEWRGRVSMFEKEASRQKQCVDAKNYFELPSNVQTCVTQIRGGGHEPVRFLRSERRWLFWPSRPHARFLRCRRAGATRFRGILCPCRCGRDRSQDLRSCIDIR